MVINRVKGVSFVGKGPGSQIFQSADTSLFDYQAIATNVGAAALTIRDLFLGSAATSPGTAIIRLEHAAHMRIENVNFTNNAKADITIDSASDIRLANITSTKSIFVTGDTRNVSVNSASIKLISIATGNGAYPTNTTEVPGPTGAKRILLQNIKTCLTGGSTSGIYPAPVFSTSDPKGYANPMVVNTSPAVANDPSDKYRKDLMYYNIQSSCSSSDDSRDN